MKPIPTESIAFLRDCGMEGDGLSLLQHGGQALITAEILHSWLRAAYVAGRRSATSPADPYVWRSVNEMISAAEIHDSQQKAPA